MDADVYLCIQLIFFKIVEQWQAFYMTLLSIKHNGD